MTNYIRGIPSRLKFVMLLGVDTALKLTAQRGSGKDVVVTRLDAIGDFILWLEAARAIVNRYRGEGRRVILAGNAAWAGWAREMDIFDEVLAVDPRKYQRSPGYRFQVGRAVQRLQCGIAIQPIFSRNWLAGDSMVRVSNARERIGNAGDTSNSRPWQIVIANRWFTKLLPAEQSEKPELERNAEFVRALGETEFRTRVPRLPAGSELDPEFARSVAGEPYYVLFPGASWKGREWPIEKFAEIADEISRETSWRCVICGGASDAAIASNLSEMVSVPAVNWVGKSSLSQLVKIIAGAKLLICNETSATHIAAATGTPTVCVLGGGHYGRFMPYEVDEVDERPLPRAITHPMPCYGCNWRCPYTPLPQSAVPCVREITTEQVWNEALRVIQSL